MNLLAKVDHFYDEWKPKWRAAGFHVGKITVLKMQEQSGDCQNREPAS
jgi:hypothetical protein